MTRLLHKFVTTKNGLVELTGGLKDFGAKGMYMTAVVGTMAQNLDVLAQQQEVAATAWDKQQSVLDEYNIMNNNFTANVLKQQKVIRAQTDHMNREAEPAVLRLVTLWASFVVGIRNATDWIAKHWTGIKNMTFAYLLLKTPAIWRISNLILESVWTKANLLLMRARIVWMQAEILWTRNLTGAQIVLMNQSKFLTIAHIALTQGIGPAIAAIRALAVSMYALPGVAVVATIAALAGAFYMLVVRKNDLTEAEKRHLALQKEVQDDFFTEKANLTVMMDRLKNANISQEERLMLIKKINSEYGQYLPRLIDEGASAEDLAKSYNLVVEALARKITYEKTSKAGADIKIEMDRTKEKIKLAKEELDAYKLTKAAQMAMMNPEANVSAMYAMDQMGTKIKKLEKSYADYAAEYTRLQSEFTAVAPRKQTIEIDNKIVDFPTEESFKDSQEALKRNFEQTELLIKQNALKTKATDEQLNENLRNAKIKYLRAQLQDMADKYRTEGEFEANYRSAQVALMDELLAQQKEGRKEGDKEEKKDAKGRIKDVKEFGEELINVEKLRISAIADEREKAVAEENLRHEQEIGKYWQNDEAIEYEEAAHLQNMADINLKYLDKQLADKAVDFAQKKNLLEQYHNSERISEEQYQTTKAALEKQEAEAMVEYKKQAGLYSADQLAALEIAELKKSEQFKALTVEEQERLIDNIKVKHGRIRAKNLKKTLDDELNDIKESMTEEQLILLEEGQKKIDIAQKVGQSLGEMFVSMFDKSQEAAAVFAKGMLKIAIEETRAFVRLQYVKLMARNVAQMGPVGVAVSLVEIGLIEAAFAVAEGLVGKINTSKEKTTTAPQNAEGRYPVIGKDDGRLYQAAYGGRPVTGVYTGPTLLNMNDGQSLVGERAPELVVDGDTFRRIQVNAPQLLRDIYAYAGKGRYMENRNLAGTAQRAEGSYPEISGTANQQSDSGKGREQEQRMISAIEKLNAHLDKGIPAYVNKYGHKGLQESFEEITKFNAITK